MAAATLFDVGVADVADTSNDYYTPPWVFDAAGLVFDMDVAAPAEPSRRTCPARRYLTPLEDGLSQPWEGLVWMNPPYSNCMPWVERFAEHGNGLALLPLIGRSPWRGPLLRRADALTLLYLVFTRPDGSQRDLPYPNALVAYGQVCVEAVSRVASADRYAQGAYHVGPPRG